MGRLATARGSFKKIALLTGGSGGTLDPPARMSESLLTSDHPIPGRAASKCIGLATLAVMFFATWGLELARVWSGQREPVSGLVTLNGQPLPGASITLHPQRDSKTSFVTPQAKTAADGTFHLQTLQTRDGAAVGRYAVTVKLHGQVINGESLADGPNLLPERYSLPSTTPLAVEIVPGVNHFDIQLVAFDDAKIVSVDRNLVMKN